MSEITYNQKVEEIDEVIDEIGNEWECDFIEDMIYWNGEYTERQKETIDNLYRKACESPY